jgi:hypothetical protein
MAPRCREQAPSTTSIPDSWPSPATSVAITINKNPGAAKTAAGGKKGRCTTKNTLSPPRLQLVSDDDEIDIEANPTARDPVVWPSQLVSQVEELVCCVDLVNVATPI